MSKRGPFVVVALTALCAASPGACGNTVGDTATVYAIYARFVMAIRIGSLLDGAAFPDEPPPVVEISDIRTGPVSEIGQTNLAELATVPSGLVLSVTPGDWNRADFAGVYGHATFATAHWRTRSDWTADWNVPFARVAHLDGLTRYARYAAFRVHLSYQGRERRYNALFLFGNDENGRATVLPIDEVIDNSALLRLSHPSTVPGPLLRREALRRAPVKAFIESIHGPDDCSIEAVTGMCCDNDGKCGLSFEELPPGLAGGDTDVPPGGPCSIEIPGASAGR
ncbi:MAG TPA: hypothetical protein VMJ34_19210 [Bryobacteraceae bacterium]|nr:hypothetical protein [Bryobacteraceae bacterium]